MSNRIPEVVDEEDPNYADKTWEIVEHAINEIYDPNSSGFSGEESVRLSQHVDIMFDLNFGKKLYSGIVDTLTSRVKEISSSIGAAEVGLFLEELNSGWILHKEALFFIRDIATEMEITSDYEIDVYQLGLNLWRDNVIRSSEIRTRLRNTFLDLVLTDRRGGVVDGGPMSSVTKMLMTLGVSVYEEEFEQPFLEVSAEFYRGESQKLIECSDCADYLRKTESCLNEEIKRVSRYLNARSEPNITNVVKKEMIENHMLRLVHMENSGLLKMLLDDKYEDLGRTYSLFRSVTNGLSTIREVMTSHLRGTGKQLVTDPENLMDAFEYVQRLLDEKDKYDKIINLAFNNDETFQSALMSSFEYFINLNPRSPEFMSLFVDDKLRKGLKGASEEDVEIILDKVMMLFRCLQDKDVFEKYYKQHLAKRLLSGKTVSDDAERSLIVKLKTECGYQFTYKLEGMFTDMKTSEDMMKGFYADQVAELGLGEGATATLAVQVLTTGAWPTQTIVTCNLPAELPSLCEKFRKYYVETHKHRILCWQTNMGTADIKATFGNGQEHELNVSTHQMCVLMLFNNADRLTYNDIEQATRIPSPDLKRCLKSLACVKGKKVLRKEPMSKDIGEDDEFFVNEKFTSKFYKVKIGTVVEQKESEHEKQETRQRVEEAGKPHIEAAIVRIMKSRRVLDHNSLIDELTEELQRRFLTNPVAMKRGIESLIERDYLERDNNDRTVYRYIP